jgi:hypothetical protein
MGQNKTAASPSYMGEYDFDKFKQIARPGQIWQTSVGMLRIDRLAGNIITRRLSKFMKFYGAYSGISPTALKSLMPQRDGKFRASSGPWTVSRKYEPFLLLKRDVREFDPESPGSQNPDQTTAITFDQPTAPNSAQESAQIDTSLDNPDELELSLPSIHADLGDDVIQASSMVALIAECQAAYTTFDATWAEHPGHDKESNQAFDIKVQRLEIPQFARDGLGESQLDDIYESYTYFTVADYCKQLPQMFGWVTEASTTGRSGGWLEVEIDISKLFDDYVNQYAPGDNADEFVDQAINDNLGGQFDVEDLNEMDALAQQEMAKYLQKLLPAIKRATLRLKKLEKSVKSEYNSYVQTMESEEFWRQEVANH